MLVGSSIHSADLSATYLSIYLYMDACTGLKFIQSEIRGSHRSLSLSYRQGCVAASNDDIDTRSE